MKHPSTHFLMNRRQLPQIHKQIMSCEHKKYSIKIIRQIMLTEIFGWPLKWLCAHSARVLELGSQSSSLWYHAWEPSIGIFIGSQFHCHFVCVQAAIFVHGGLMLLYFICCKYLAHNDKKCYYVLSYTSKLSSQCFVNKKKPFIGS